MEAQVRATVLSKIFRKIRLVAASDLVLADKFRYLAGLGSALLKNALRQNTTAYEGSRKLRLRGGASILLRGHSTDEKVFEEVFLQRAYAPYAKIASKLEPTILVDLGANIGLSVIALARELQPQSIVAVEPDRGNFAALQENLRLAGLTDRCTTVQAFAGGAYGFAELIDSGNGAWGMRMGAPAATGIQVLALREIIDLASPADANGSSKKVVLKCDIEGAELHLFQHLLDWEEPVHYVILELHTEFLSVDKFHACLEASRYHWRRDGEIPAHAVLGVIGLERLGRKAMGHQQRGAHS